MKNKALRCGIFFSAVFMVLAALWLLLPSASVTASAEESRSEVYRRVDGSKRGYCDLTAIPTDGLSLSVSVDMASGAFGYVGIKATSGGAGQPAAGQRSIGILLYNSVDTCLAVEVYDGYVWQQMVNTTEMFGISPSERVTLKLKKQDGVWGLYINDTLFTGRARSGIEGVAEGAVINPLAYIAESEFSADGVSYFELGTWESGGSISVYKQVSQGVLLLYDREYRPIEQAGIVAAYNVGGDPMALLESTFQNGRYTVSTLSGDKMAAFSVETAGGVRRTVNIGGETVVKDKDIAVTVTDGQSPLDDVAFTVLRQGEHIENAVTIERTGVGQYLLWDINDAVTVMARRVGFAPSSVTVPADATACTISLAAQSFYVGVQAFDAFSGSAVRVGKEHVGVYCNGEAAEEAEIIENAGETLVRGLRGRLENYTVRIEGLDGYADAEKAFDERSANGILTVYVQKKYDATVTVQDENGHSVPDAQIETKENTVPTVSGVGVLTDLCGDVAVTVKATGYAEREVLLTEKSAVVTVVLHLLGQKQLRVDGVADGTTVHYTVGGLRTFAATVQDGKITLDDSVADGDKLTATIAGYYVRTSVTVGSDACLTAEKIHSVVLRFVYNGEAAANTRITFDRVIEVTDAQGYVRLDMTDSPLRILSAEGYATVSQSEISVLGDEEISVQLRDKIYSAFVTVVDGDGQPVRNVSVRIGEFKAQKEEGVFSVHGLTGLHTVTVDGKAVGEVSETDAVITVVLSDEEVPSPAPEKKGCGSSLSGSGMPWGVLCLTVAAVLLRKEKRRKSNESAI